MPVILGGNTGIYLASLAPSVDPDAQAFITAAAITNPTQQAAINTLVVDLKGYNVWTKMKAIYPFVGGTNSQHTWNLKNTAQYQISWIGGVTHSANGVLFGGLNGWANTNFSPSSILAENNNHVSVYSRTAAARTNAFAIDWGQSTTTSGDNAIFGSCRRSSNLAFYAATNAAVSGILTASNTDGSGMYVNSITSATSRKIYKNTITLATLTSNISQTLSSFNIAIGALNCNSGADLYSDYQAAFFSIGDGLTDTEASNFYTAVQAFQTTLGRSIGTQTVSDADAQAFVTNAGIVDQVEANAINNLVIGMKADGLWAKMKAVYPFVGSSSSSFKYNLKNPLDTDAAFRLTYGGGLTYSSTGLLGGVNGYADTKLVPSSVLSLNSTHISFYSRTDTSTSENVEMGVNDISNTSRLFIAPKFSGANTAYRSVNSAQAGPGTSPNMQGFFIASRVISTAMKLYRNGSVLFNDSTSSGSLWNTNMFLLCYNNSGTPTFYTDRECAFASIGDGLDDTDATNLNTRVTTFQTSLNRNI